MRKFLDFFSWGFLLLFFIPTGLILASWNALPGDSLYGTKLAFESTLLAMAKPSLSASGTLSIKYTERRFSETKQLLANKHSVEGLPYLNRQVVETRAIITQAPPSATQRELARAYLVSLQNVSTQLEQQKQIALAQTTQSNTPSTLTQQRSGSFVLTQTPTQVSTSTLTQTVQTPQVSAPSQQEQQPVQPTQVNEPVPSSTTVVQIAQTQQTISQTIDELEKIANESEKDKHDNEGKKDQNMENKDGQGQDNGKGKDH